MAVWRAATDRCAALPQLLFTSSSVVGPNFTLVLCMFWHCWHDGFPFVALELAEVCLLSGSSWRTQTSSGELHVSLAAGQSLPFPHSSGLY